MARSPETPLGQFLAEHSQLRLGELGRAIGEVDLTSKIRRVQQHRRLLQPDELDKIAHFLDPDGQRMLVAMMARDARLPGHTDVGLNEGAPGKIIAEIQNLSRKDKFDLIVWLVRDVEDR